MEKRYYIIMGSRSPTTVFIGTDYKQVKSRDDAILFNDSDEAKQVIDKFPSPSKVSEMGWNWTIVPVDEKTEHERFKNISQFDR